MGTSSPPAAPSPQATASAQTGENVSTAIANADLSHVNQTNAYGDTSTYNQTGSTSFTDPTSGKVYQIPTYSQTTQLSAPQQNLYNTVQSAQQGAANTAQGLIGQAQSTLSKPIDLTANGINKFTNTQWEQPFNNYWGQQQDKLTQQLADQGINVGSQAYNNATQNFGQTVQNAQDTYDTSMYGNAMNAATTSYNQPVNELSALLSNSQIGSPSMNATPTQTQIPTTDYASIANQGFQNQMASYNAQQQQTSAMYGGLFGLGGAAISAFPTRGASLAAGGL